MDDVPVITASMAVSEDDDESSGCDDCGYEVLSVLGNLGNEETERDLKFGDELSTEQRPDDMCQLMVRSSHSSEKDLSNSYWQISVRQTDIPKTAFVAIGRNYEFLRMSFDDQLGS
ncbi:hypothetical protein PoB_003783400 [Plakobranchus ocellatus]|uniref:Uncharacterized protein n=1 Tax=Plakobranchus ocellatus TaxID=259542 RepID=A0AAV4AU60_9GAST|nr:hypothetical protein PoB_003783400 [Plakobranchus ocellatus]